MALVTPPAKMPIKRIQWTPLFPHQQNRSGWTGRRQVSTFTPTAAMWTVSVEFSPIVGEANAKPWRGFFTSLNGRVNHFPVVAAEGAQHGGTNPTIASGAAMASQVTLAGTIPALQRGDYMTVKLADGTYQLVCLTAPIAGATASFLPALRAAAATGPGSVETVLPFAHVALAEDSFGYDVQPGQVYGFSFSAEEAF